MLRLFRERYRCKVGLSDHSGTIFPGLAAVVLGCDVLEVHIVFDRMMPGPDVEASITIAELRQLVRGVRYVESMLAHPVDKDAVASEMQPMRAVFTKSVVAVRDLPAGTTLQPEHLTTRKPGTGIPASQLAGLVGRRLARSVPANMFLDLSDLMEDQE
jgi:N-acetylneuraminate synthase